MHNGRRLSVLPARPFARLRRALASRRFGMGRGAWNGRSNPIIPLRSEARRDGRSRLAAGCANASKCFSQYYLSSICLGNAANFSLPAPPAQRLRGRCRRPRLRRAVPINDEPVNT